MHSTSVDGSANHLRILIILLAVAGVLLAVAGLGTISASRVYCVETELSAAPDDDTALEFWLRNQPGVVQHTVRVDRVTTDRPKLVLTLMMVQNGWLNQSGRNSASDFDQSVTYSDVPFTMRPIWHRVVGTSSAADDYAC